MSEVAPRPWRELDQTSLMSFALALTVVGAPVGIVLGVRGLRRTEGGVKSGRWAAVLGIVLGIAALLGVVLGAVGLHWFRDNVKSIARAEVGDCVDVVDGDDSLSFTSASCTDRHQAEIVAAGEWSSREEDLFFRSDASAADLCFREADEHYQRAARTGRYQVTLVIGADDPREPRTGDAYACYFTLTKGGSLSDPISAPGGRSA